MAGKRKRRVGDGGYEFGVSRRPLHAGSVVRARSHGGTLSAMRFRKDAKLDRSQVEDLRGRRVGGTPMALGGGGIVTLIIIIAIALLGGNPLDTGGGALPSTIWPGQTAGNGPPSSTLEHCQTGQDANEHQDCRILAVVNSVQKYWSTSFRGYEPARTTFFTGGVSTGCGQASSAVGPFYCPADRNVYIDLGFFEQLQSQFGASGGPLAEAYVLAHEYGHHIQNLTGVLRRAQSRDTGPQSNAVRVELQADCYAGVWVANAVRTGLIVEITRKDIQDGLSAAAAVGDDRIQEKAQGSVNPEAWTHGSAEQRQSWFVRGIEGGSANSCDTFSGPRLAQQVARASPRPLARRDQVSRRSAHRERDQRAGEARPAECRRLDVEYSLSRVSGVSPSEDDAERHQVRDREHRGDDDRDDDRSHASAASCMTAASTRNGRAVKTNP